MAVGNRYIIIKDFKRAFPIHIALLIVDSEWNFYGYCMVHSALVKDQKTEIEFEVLTLFSPDEQKLYREKFLAAAKMIGEVR